MSPPALQTHYPWISTPLIVSAPMGGGAAGPALASAVSHAGGLGFLGFGYEMNEAWFDAARGLTAGIVAKHGLQTLPVGAGVLCFAADREAAVQLIAKHVPAAAWLFAPKQQSDLVAWVVELRAQSPKTRIWIQLNSVAEALFVAAHAAPDVIVAQGTDAGGHGNAKGASVISLVPEIVDALAAAGHGDIAVLAAGGIADARGVAAALALGAQGAVMGTRFLAAKETQQASARYRQSLLEARDGGQSTMKSSIFDEMREAGNMWPIAMDGRALRNRTTRDMGEGVSVEENRKRSVLALKGDDRGLPQDVAEQRAAVWAGTGVGLVNSVESAEGIVLKARDGVATILQSVSVSESKI